MLRRSKAADSTRRIGGRAGADDCTVMLPAGRPAFGRTIPVGSGCSFNLGGDDHSLTGWNFVDSVLVSNH